MSNFVHVTNAATIKPSQWNEHSWRYVMDIKQLLRPFHTPLDFVQDYQSELVSER